MDIDVYYDESFTWGECFTNDFLFEGHNFHLRYKLLDENSKIIHVYECKNCNALKAFYFYGGNQFSSYISFPEILFKEIKCGEKFNKLNIAKTIFNKFDKRMYINFKAGLFSGFPLCCVIYFSLIRSIPYDPGFYGQIKHIIRRKKFRDFDLSHVMCPICAIRNHNVEGKADIIKGECINTSLIGAIKSAINWRLLSDKDKKYHNNTHKNI